MKRIKIPFIILYLSILVLASFMLKFIFFWPSDLIFKPAYEFHEGKVIEIRTMVNRFGIQKGDIFSYFIEVYYDPALIEEIDKNSLNKMINMEPFEIIDVKEKEIHFQQNITKYQREYELQLLNGQVNQYYEFPTMIVRYKTIGSSDFSVESVQPTPLYVASRLPLDVGNLKINGVKEELTVNNHLRISWIIVCLGGILLLLGLIIRLARRITLLEEEKKCKQEIEGYDLLKESYYSMQKNINQGVEPKCLFHQIDHILRMLLMKKEKIDWLKEPNLQLLPLEVREKIFSLLKICQKAYQPSVQIDQKEIDNTVQQLQVILDFYYKGEKEFHV